MDCETDLYQNGYCSVHPCFLLIKISQRESFKYGDTISCFLSWCLLLIYSMSVYLSHALGRCSSLISVLSAFGCAVWLCWCGTFYCVIFFHKECGRGLVGAELHELTALWMACHRFLFTSFVCFYRSLFICTHISYWWILYKTSDIL